MNLEKLKALVKKYKFYWLGASAIVLIGGGAVFAFNQPAKTSQPVETALVQQETTQNSSVDEQALESQIESQLAVENVDEKTVLELEKQVEQINDAEAKAKLTEKIVSVKAKIQSQSSDTTANVATNANQETPKSSATSTPTKSEGQKQVAQVQPKQETKQTTQATQPKNQNQSTQNTTASNNNTTSLNGAKGTKNSDGSASFNAKIITKENTKQKHPDEWYINKYARDSQGRRVPVFKTMKEAFEWGEKHAENETWYGAQGWTARMLMTETGVTLGYYPYMHSFD